MEHPTAFYQEVHEALVPFGLSDRDMQGFSITITETYDTENYRIERHHIGVGVISYWEGIYWDDVLAKCIESHKSPF